MLDNTLSIDRDKVNIDDHLLSNLDEDINTKINELVDLLVQSKYGSITFYYDTLLDNVIKSPNDNNEINLEKIGLLIEIIDSYYDDIIGISNFFNIK